MNTKKLSAPGRRASNRPRAAFKADSDTVVSEINTNVTPSLNTSSDRVSEDVTKKAKEEEENRAQAVAKAQAEAKAEAEERERVSERVAQEAKEKEEKERELAEQQKRQKGAEEQAAKEEKEARRVAQREAEEAAEREEQAQYEARVATEKAKRQRVREEEAARKRAEEEAEELRNEQEAAEELRNEKEAAEEEARKKAEEAVERAEAEQAAREKAEKKKQKDEARRLAEEEAEREEQAAFEAKVAKDKAERQRLREEAKKQAEEEARRAAEEEARRVAEAEEAKRIAEEEEVRRVAEDEARRVAEEEETIAAAQLAAKEELEREKREMEEEQAAEREALRQQAEEEAAAERARALAAAQEEEARLAKVKAKAAAERKKRNAFLDDMDSFSSSFEQTQSEKESARLRAEEESSALLSGTIASARSGYVSQSSSDRTERQRQAAAEEEAEERRRHEEKVLAYEREAALEAQREADLAAELQRKQNDEEIALIPSEAPAQDFNDLASSLFASKISTKDEETRAPIASKSDLFGSFGDEDSSSNNKNDPFGVGVTNAKDDEGDDILSMPKIDRVMTVKRGQNKSQPQKETAPANQSNDISLYKSQESVAQQQQQQQQQQSAKVSSRIVANSDVLGNFSDDEEDDCGEDLSKADRLAWRAKQEDLSNMRKDFHGAVTYAFGGCFSWQMYSAVDAVDEHGKNYTEYLMRLQWGTNWDNMQPWLVARRYREFDTLNDLLLQNYPNAKHKMHPLPKKQFFGSLDPNTVEQRTKDIEAYVCTIVTNLPSMLKSRYIDGFFSVHERIAQIKKQIEEEKRKAIASGKGDPNASNLFDGVVPLAPGTIEELGLSKEDEAPVVKKVQKLVVGDLLTTEEVEARCGDDVRGFDDDGLGQAEEKIRDFRRRLTKTSTKYLTKDTTVRALLDECQALWPRLHATCRIGDNVVDSMLIARAMQAEEDLEAAVRELRSFLAAQSMGSPLHC